MNDGTDDRDLDELLIRRANNTLDDDARQQLDQRIANEPAWAERAAAVAAMAEAARRATDRVEPLPIESMHRLWEAIDGDEPRPVPAPGNVTPMVAQPPAGTRRRGTSGSSPVRIAVAAAAAMILLVGTLALVRLGRSPDAPGQPTTIAVTNPAPPTSTTPTTTAITSSVPTTSMAAGVEFATVSDDTGSISLDVPASWTWLATGPDGEGSPSLVAAPREVDIFDPGFAAWDSPFVIATRLDDYDETAPTDWWWTDECETSSDETDALGTVSATVRLHTGCSESGAGIAISVLGSPGDSTSKISVEIVMPDGSYETAMAVLQSLVFTPS